MCVCNFAAPCARWSNSPDALGVCSGCSKAKTNTCSRKEATNTPPESPRFAAVGTVRAPPSCPRDCSAVWSAALARFVVLRSELIATPEEAKEYYVERIAGVHTVNCHGKPVRIFFERSATHMLSEECPPSLSIPPSEQIVRRVKGGRVEVRRFSLDRARLMDRALEAVERYTVSTPGTGQSGHEKSMLHGPRLPDGRYLRVVLRPDGPGDFTCVSAYPVSEAVWLDARRAKSAKFPP